MSLFSSAGEHPPCWLSSLTPTWKQRNGVPHNSQMRSIAAGMDERRDDEQIVVLIPKRHVETWIRALLGNQVDEVTDYTKAPYSTPVANDIKDAATKLHEWTRPGANPGPTSPASLTASLPEWRKIPS